MPTINLKIAAIVVLLVAFIAFAMHYDYLREESDRKDAEITRLDEVLANKDSLVNKERPLADDAAKREQKTADDLRVKDDEIKKLRDCFDAGKCVLRMRNSPTENNSKLPNTASSGSEPARANAEYTRALEQNYIRLTEVIGLVEVNYAALQRELIARSDKDYCNPSSHNL